MEEDVAAEMEQEEVETTKRVEQELRSKDSNWERRKTTARVRNTGWSNGRGKKHCSPAAPKEQRPSKRRKYALLTNWGETSEAKTTLEGGMETCTDRDRAGSHREEQGSPETEIDKEEQETTPSLAPPPGGRDSQEDTPERRLGLYSLSPVRRAALVTSSGHPITTGLNNRTLTDEVIQGGAVEIVTDDLGEEVGTLNSITIGVEDKSRTPVISGTPIRNLTNQKCNLQGTPLMQIKGPG